MINNFFKFTIISICLSIYFSSCSKNKSLEINKNEINKINSNSNYIQDDIILGEKKQNPYSISNMEIALATTKNNGYNSINPIKIKPTHYYVKFKPNNEEQYEMLASDTNLKIYDYPLDYKILQLGNRYHDPSLPSNVPTFQYASVKTNFHFNPNIPYEIIEELYIPEEDSNINPNLNQDFEFLNNLLDNAYIQTNNFEDTIKNYNPSYKVSNYTPGGKIQTFDTRLNNLIGLEGIEVRARRWFTTYTGTTNYYGNYSVNGSFSRPCNYSIWFTTFHFAIREHLFGLTHHIDGPKIKNDWNYDIQSGYDRFQSHIFRGAYRYHYKDISGLQRPFRPNGNRTLYIGKDEEKNWSGINYIVFPILKIARYNGNLEYNSDEIFSTTCHETAHTSHVIKMNTGVLQYSQVTNQLKESWAIGVEWLLTGLEYKSRGITNYGEWNYSTFVQYPNMYGYQYWNNSKNNDDYSSLFINLVDNFNELGQVFPFRPTGAINDQVHGYTLVDIENNILKHSYGLSSLSTKLKANKPNGVTDALIDQLLSYY